MKNLAAISLGSNPDRASEDPVQSDSLPPFGRHLEPARLVSQRLRRRLEAAGLSCGEGAPGKPFGWYFVATANGKRFVVAVCPDQIPLPHTSMTITAQPFVGFKDRLFRKRRLAVENQNWTCLQPDFTHAVNAEFSDYHPRWMTFNEWFETIDHEQRA